MPGQQAIAAFATDNIAVIDDRYIFAPMITFISH